LTTAVPRPRAAAMGIEGTAMAITTGNKGPITEPATAAVAPAMAAYFYLSSSVETPAREGGAYKVAYETPEDEGADVAD
jgi:hypothetical protein